MSSEKGNAIHDGSDKGNETISGCNTGKSINLDTWNLPGFSIIA